MYNILLDPLPDTYEGYLIRTDYQIGLQISLVLDDAEFTEEEKIWIALDLLYGTGKPSVEMALDGLSWFMRGGADPVEVSGAPGTRSIWFDFDAPRIFASFQKSFGLEIHKKSMHWFAFLALLDCIDEDSSLAHAIQIRATNTSKMKGQERAMYERLKKRLTPKPKYTPEEQAAIDTFWRQFELEKQEKDH